MAKILGRRRFLRGAGAALALPWLDAMARGATADPALRSDDDPAAAPRRFVAIGTPFGFYPPALIPTQAGPDYPLTPHLALLAPFRRDFTIVSGLSHPHTEAASHKSEPVLLTGAPDPGTANFRNSVSADQLVAERHRGRTRFDSLALTTFYGSLSFTRAGVEIPAESSPSALFAKLFLATTPEQAEAELRSLEEGRSTLDLVAGQARRLRGEVGASDRHRLDEYFAAVRDVERQMTMAKEWVRRPKPKVAAARPSDIAGPGNQTAKLRLMVDLIHLALATDSVRAVTLRTFGDHHDLSHHGKEERKLADCRKVEADLVAAFGTLLGKLKGSAEGGATLLDRTALFLGSNLKDGNTHATDNLPAIVAGGGFRHRGHLAFNPAYLAELAAADAKPGAPKPPAAATDKPAKAPPLCNLFLSMLHAAGAPANGFGSATGTLNGLERA